MSFGWPIGILAVIGFLVVVQTIWSAHVYPEWAEPPLTLGCPRA